MTGTSAELEFEPNFASWSAPGQSFRIEYSTAVLDQIREIAVDGYHRLPRGGVETGGILFGTHEESVVRIMAWREIVCEYAKGPSFLLSAKDEAAVAEALQSWRDDAELAGMEPIGWSRAHTRSEILLSDADLAFFDKFFPQPWQVGLIVHPASFAPTRAGFFFREADGSIRAQSSYLEFILAPVAAARAPQPAADAPESPLAAPPELRPVLGTAPQARARGSRGIWKWYAVGLAAMAIAALGVWLLKPSHAGLTLSATDLGRQQLRIAWDAAAGPIGQARSGLIEIDDHGVRTRVNLTPTDLRSGRLFYERQSGNVAIWLTVNVPGNPPVVEVTRFLRAGEPVPAPLPAAKQPELPARSEASEAHAGPPSSLPPPAPVKPAQPVVSFREPSAPRQAPANAPSLAPPAIDNLPASPQAGLSSALGRVLVSTANPAAPPRPAAASGRIIWTGRLAKNGRLTVEGSHASSGAISGVLPAVTAHASAYPGDLTAEGITLFTADPRYSPPLTEKAGAENGWNSTTYTWNPKRAGGIKIVEQPSPDNGYKLVLESDLPKVPVVMIEWRAAQSQ